MSTSGLTVAEVRPAASARAEAGPLLLAGVGASATYAGHRERWGLVPQIDLAALMDLTREAMVTGRGGAGFPFFRKLATVRDHRRLTRRPQVVVNAAEGEPLSAKDSVLLSVSPHLVLDGAAQVARALDAREVTVVTGGERRWVAEAVRSALAERTEQGIDRGLRWRHTITAARFVSGQAQAVLEHLAGRAALPVTAWVPEAVHGVRGAPTLLSNAETFAQVAAVTRVGLATYRDLGTPEAPGTTLLTITPASSIALVAHDPLVREVGYGTTLSEILTPEQLSHPVLVGGFHGTWTPPAVLDGLVVTRAAFAERGLSLGAGIIAPVGNSCPVALTAQIVDFLASESAGRCGPCLNGLPALAEAMEDLRYGTDSTSRLDELCGVVSGRGACAHPDGTARLVRTLLSHLAQAVDAHLQGICECGARP